MSVLNTEAVHFHGSTQTRSVGRTQSLIAHVCHSMLAWQRRREAYAWLQTWSEKDLQDIGLHIQAHRSLNGRHGSL